MKAFKSFALAALIAFVAVGCSNVEKILPKKDGKWKAITTVNEEFVNSVSDTTYTITYTTANEFTYTFDKDDKGTYADADTSYAFTWTVNDDNDEVTMCIDFAGVDICLTSTVLESEKDRQVWLFSDKVSGDVDWSEQTTTLERVK